MVSGPPILPCPLPFFHPCHPIPGKGDSWEVPDGHSAQGAPPVRGFPENIGLWVQAPHWIIMSLGRSRVRGRETPTDPHPKSLLKPKPSQATLAQCQEESLHVFNLSPHPNPLHFLQDPQYPAEYQEREARSSPERGEGCPRFSMPLFSGGKFFRAGKRWASPSPGCGGGGTKP